MSANVSSFQPADYGLVAPALSSDDPLGSSASFTSPWIETRHIATIRIGVLTDQAGSLHTQHSDDNGVTILRDSVQPVEASKGEFLSFHPRNAFFRVVYTNGSVAQTLFHLETVLHSVAVPPTQSLVSAKLGRTSLAIQSRDMVYDYEMDETVGVAPQIRDLQVVQRTSIIADNFRQAGGLDAQTWDTAVTGTGSAAIVNGRLEIATGTTANSTAAVNSEALGRFISGSHQLFRVGVKITDSGVANNKRRFGAFDSTSGYFFEIDGSILYAVSRRASTDTRVAAADFSDIQSFDPFAKSARYEIIYFGNTAIFSINGETHHRMTGEVGGLPRTNATNFPNRFECVNSGGSTTNVVLVVTGTSQQRYGPDITSPRYKRVTGNSATVLKSDAGRLHRVIVGKGAGFLAIYDQTSAAAPQIANMELEQKAHFIEFMVDFYNGLTVQATDAGADITYIYD